VLPGLTRVRREHEVRQGHRRGFAVSRPGDHARISLVQPQVHVDLFCARGGDIRPRVELGADEGAALTARPVDLPRGPGKGDVEGGGSGVYCRGQPPLQERGSMVVRMWFDRALGSWNADFTGLVRMPRVQDTKGERCW
jgi:hypothetical protein